jgi:hypothetical protein
MSDLVRMRRDLANERHNLRAAALVVAYSGALFALGLGITTQVYLGIVLMSVAACGFLFGAGWAVRYGTRAARYARDIRLLTQLPAARVIDR